MAWLRANPRPANLERAAPASPRFIVLNRISSEDIAINNLKNFPNALPSARARPPTHTRRVFRSGRAASSSYTHLPRFASSLVTLVGDKPGGTFTENRLQGLREGGCRDAFQIQRWDQRVDTGRTAGIFGQNRTCEPLSFPAVVHTRLQGEMCPRQPFHNHRESGFNPLPSPKQGEIQAPLRCRWCCPSFNPLPSPKQGEISTTARYSTTTSVSIRSPHRSKGRSAGAPRSSHSG